MTEAQHNDDALKLAVLFYETHGMLDLTKEARPFDADSPEGRLLISVCEVILAVWEIERGADEGS